MGSGSKPFQSNRRMRTSQFSKYRPENGEVSPVAFREQYVLYRVAGNCNQAIGLSAGFRPNRAPFTGRKIIRA